MHYVYAKFDKTVYHLFSDPDYYRTVEIGKAFAGFYRRAQVATGDRVPEGWVTGGRKSAHDFAKAYWGSGMVLDLTATTVGTTTRPAPHGRT